jgi:hypothetical protein
MNVIAVHRDKNSPMPDIMARIENTKFTNWIPIYYDLPYDDGTGSATTKYLDQELQKLKSLSIFTPIVYLEIVGHGNPLRCGGIRCSTGGNYVVVCNKLKGTGTLARSCILVLSACNTGCHVSLCPAGDCQPSCYLPNLAELIACELGCSALGALGYLNEYTFAEDMEGLFSVSCSRKPFGTWPDTSIYCDAVDSGASQPPFFAWHYCRFLVAPQERKRELHPGETVFIEKLIDTSLFADFSGIFKGKALPPTNPFPRIAPDVQFVANVGNKQKLFGFFANGSVVKDYEAGKFYSLADHQDFATAVLRAVLGVYNPLAYEVRVRPVSVSHFEAIVMEFGTTIVEYGHSPLAAIEAAYEEIGRLSQLLRFNGKNVPAPRSLSGCGCES